MSVIGWKSWLSAHLAFGGMAGIPKRATHAETALTCQPWTRETVEAAMAVLPQDFQPMTDMRASADYRMQTAQNLLLRYFLETEATDTPLRIEDVA